MPSSPHSSRESYLSIHLERLQALKVLTHPVTVSFGVASLCLLALTGPLISSNHDLVYHLKGSAPAIFVPVMIYVVALFLILAPLLSMAEKPGLLRVAVWSGIVFALPWILFVTFAGFFDAAVPAGVSTSFALVCFLCFVVSVVGRNKLLPVFEGGQPFVATMLGFFALCGLWIFLQLAYSGWQSRGLNSAPRLHHAQLTEGQPHQRIVWILLDELSYQQIYEHRFPGLKLPAFDQLAAESTVFTDVTPAGKYTRYIIPSLFTGIPSDEIRVSGGGLLISMHDTATGKWDRFREQGTVFQDALNAGYSTGVAGWYNPYCRILPDVLDRCYWTYHEVIPAGFEADHSIGWNLLVPFRRLDLDVKHALGEERGPPSGELLDIQTHTADYRGLLAAGDALLSDPSINFLFLHIPVPHPLGFYDRTTRAFSTHPTSYIDNLALADVYVAHVRELLEREHQWDSSVIVVMGDHSWRTSFVWAGKAGWTAEDAAASHGGKFDPRPAYLVKLANQHVADRVDQPFAAVRTRALFDAVLQNRIRTPEELEEWARR